MKKLITLLTLFLTLPFYGQWVQQNSGTVEKLNDVYCISENVVFVVGNNGTILKTTDGGNNWVLKTSGTIQDLTKVQFANVNLGFAIGNNGTLLKTINGGDDWTSITTNLNTNLYGLSVLNEAVFYIAGENGTLKKTTTGGVNFTTQNLVGISTIYDVQYLNESTGYIRGDKLYKTIDGGTSWSAASDDFISSFFFRNENVGFINTVNSGIFRTIDGAVTSEYLGFSNFYVVDLFATADNTVWGVEDQAPLCNCPGYCIIKENINGDIYQSVSNCDLSNGFVAISFSSTTVGYAVGVEGVIFKNATGIMLQVNQINDLRLSTISPNPAHNQLEISFSNKPEDFITVKISDCVGKVIYRKIFDSEKNLKVELDPSTPGMYFVTIESGDITETKKIIIN